MPFRFLEINIKEYHNMTELINHLKAINHPNIEIKIFPPGVRLENLERAAIFYPLSPRHFVLFEMEIKNDDPIFKESTKYLFIYEHIFISSSLGLDFYTRSDGASDAHGSSCRLLYEKTGIKSFGLFYDNGEGTNHIDLNLNDGNIFRSVGFKSSNVIPDYFIPSLNQALMIKKWE
jgi:hypothetical protein